MTPAIWLIPPSEEAGRSIETADDSRLWREERKLAASSAGYFDSSAKRLSLCLLREKSDRPPEDCLVLSDMATAVVVTGRSWPRQSSKRKLYFCESYVEGNVDVDLGCTM